MPKFSYVAMDTRGKETKGTIEVASQNEAIGRIKEMGYFPTKVVEVDKAKDKTDPKKGGKGAAGKKKGINLNFKIPGLGTGVKTKSLVVFTRQLATLVEAGLPLLRGLRVLESRKRTPRSKKSSEKFRCPSRAAARFPRAWPNIRKFSTGFMSTWSRRASWAVCSKSS